MNPPQRLEPTMKFKLPRPLSWRSTAALTALAALVLAACSGGGGSSGNDTVTINGDVPIAYAKRSTAVTLNPLDGAGFAAGGDLMVRDKSSASGTETNLTAKYTQGAGDVSKPEVSYDGKKILFAMNCPAANTATVDNGAGPVPACTGHWNIWEYDTTAGGLTGGSFRRITASGSDDVDPVYLPAGGGIVFSSNRQATSSQAQALGHAYLATDEYERQVVFNLHTMALDGSRVQQISFNQSHDRNPTIRPDGNIMFSRWEHVADRNRFAVFTVKPDGTNMFVFYGAHSAGNSYLHPRDMDPKGAYAGKVVSDLMPLSRTQEGGSLRMLDVSNYSEDNTPANSSVPPVGGQVEITAQSLNEGTGISLYGRATAPYPLWDGTDRILVAWHACEVTNNGVVVPCSTLSAAQVARLSDGTRTIQQVQTDTLQDNVPAAYGIYMFNPANQTWLAVATPPAGYMYTTPVALLARPEPGVLQPTVVDPVLAAQNLALIEVRSVYDTDLLQRMAEPMLVASDHPGCSVGIAQVKPADPTDTRATVADLARIKDPAQAAYGCAPARFVRATRAVAPPSGSTGVRNAIGETMFEQVQILGYAAVEPDGSFKLQVPADTPLAFSVVDSQGRSIQTHTNWIQARPGERRTCDGCHSPRRGAAINSGAIVDTLPAALTPALASQHQSGETMASTRTRLDASLLSLKADPVYTDVWADTTRVGVTARPSIALLYTGNANPADDLATAAPSNGVINYVQHIQPLWDRVRGSNGVNTCTNCHVDTVKLDLRGTLGGSGRLTSYEELTVGDPVIGADGKPVIQIEDGVPMVVRGPSLVDTSSGDANSAGQSRKSRLTEVLWGQTLLAGSAAAAAFPAPPASAPDHSTLLNKAEKRLLAEWMDIGGQYYNDPYASGANVLTVPALSQATFNTQVQPVLAANCASCHQAGLGNPQNRFVLTGNAQGDYNVTLGMIDDTCSVATNPLLARPSTVPHPAGALTQVTAVLPVGSAGYNQIATWIATGCPKPIVVPARSTGRPASR
jgi:hypothetical protein